MLYEPSQIQILRTRNIEVDRLRHGRLGLEHAIQILRDVDHTPSKTGNDNGNQGNGEADQAFLNVFPKKDFHII
jgi:hypothetical protein